MALDFPRGPFGIIYADPPWRYHGDKGGRPALGGFTKPAEVRSRIVALAGDLPRVELFARERAPGWEAWGNELEEGYGTSH